MPYTRKTRDEYVLLADYGYGYEEETAEETSKEIRQRLKEYRENAPQYLYKIKVKRVKI
jgi:hypothetical protein